MKLGSFIKSDQPSRELTLYPFITWSPEEKKLRLGCLKWITGTVGNGKGYGNKLSLAIEIKVPDLWIGCFWKRSDYKWELWICLIPCIPIRISWHWSYGGSF